MYTCRKVWWHYHEPTCSLYWWLDVNLWDQEKPSGTKKTKFRVPRCWRVGDVLSTNWTISVPNRSPMPGKKIVTFDIKMAREFGATANSKSHLLRHYQYSNDQHFSVPLIAGLWWIPCACKPNLGHIYSNHIISIAATSKISRIQRFPPLQLLSPASQLPTMGMVRGKPAMFWWIMLWYLMNKYSIHDSRFMSQW